MADASIFAQFLKAPPSALDYADRYAASDMRAQENALSRLTMQEKTQAMGEQNRLRQLYQQNPNATPEQLRGAGFRDEASKADAAALERRKTESDIGLKGAQTDKAKIEADSKAADMAYEKLTRHAQEAMGAQSLQDIVAWVDRGIANGVPGFTPETRAQAIEKAQGTGSVDAWKKAVVEGATPIVEKFKADADMKRAQLSADTSIATNAATNATSRANNSATVAQSERASVRADRRSGESNLIKASEVAAGGKPPPGYRWLEGGRLEAIPGGPGDKLPEKQQNQVIGTQNLSNAIKEYRSQLSGFGKWSALSPDQRAAMGTKYNNMMLQAKEAYNLGVLNGPDLEILTSVITDPRSFKGAITSNKALDAQAAELDRIMGGISTVSANRRPQDAAPKQDKTKLFSDADAILKGGR